MIYEFALTAFGVAAIHWILSNGKSVAAVYVMAASLAVVVGAMLGETPCLVARCV